MPTLEEISFYPEGTPDFVSQLYVSPLEKPSNVGTLKVVLLRLAKKTRQYGKHKNAAGTDVWTFIVMDGSFGVFEMVLNSAKCGDIPHEDLHAGALLFMERGEYRVIMKHREDDGTVKAVLFVDNFDWSLLPMDQDDNEKLSSVTPEHTSAWIDRDAIDLVQTKHWMVFLKSFPHEKGFQFWVRMSLTDVLVGDFTVDETLKKNWVSKKRQREEEDAKCCCQESPYCFTECILTSYPMGEVDEYDLFQEAKEKLAGRVTANSFNDLQANHKRWCYYWYYAINFFHFGGGEPQELPRWFVEAVRGKYSDPNGQCTGFKRQK